MLPRAAGAAGWFVAGSTITQNTSTVLFTNSDIMITNGQIAASGSPSIVVGGSWTVTNGSFTQGTSTVTFNGTTSGNIITTHGSPFYNAFFTGSGGSWTLQSSMTVTSTMTIASGALFNLNGSSLTVSSCTISGTLQLFGTEAVSSTPSFVTGSTVTYDAPSGAAPVLSTWT